MGLESGNSSTVAESSFANHAKSPNADVFLDVCKGTETSQSLGKIFLEEERGFRAVDNINLSNSCKSPDDNARTSVEVTVIDNYWKILSHYCYGLLSGVALWQWVIVFQLSPPRFDIVDFANHYGHLTHPFELLINLLCTITTVSSFDRFYSSDGNFSFRMLLHSKTRTCMAILYPLALVISLSMGHIDEVFDYYKMKIPGRNSTELLELNEDITYWQSMNTARCLIVILGWVAVVLQQE